MHRNALSLVPVALTAATLLTAAIPANAAFINTNSIAVYNTFATGATIQNFESVAGMTPLSISAYGNPVVPASAQLGGQISGVFFHSGGASFNNPAGNPGTPAALLTLTGAISANAHSGTNVVGSLAINTTTLDLTQFVEIIFTNNLQNRAGVWLNPALGNVTIIANDSGGNQLESGTGTGGNFVGFQRAANDIKTISIVGGPTKFTIDDLTYGVASSTSAAPEPATLPLMAFFGAAAVLAARLWRQRRRCTVLL